MATHESCKPTRLHDDLDAHHICAPFVSFPPVEQSGSNGRIEQLRGDVDHALQADQMKGFQHQYDWTSNN